LKIRALVSQIAPAVEKKYLDKNYNMVANFTKSVAYRILGFLVRGSWDVCIKFDEVMAVPVHELIAKTKGKFLEWERRLFFPH
jgi:hypothetical protein